MPRETIAGGLSGAATGATIGSAVPGIGTAIGAGVGGVLGGIGGLFGGGGDDRLEQAQQRQAELADFVRQRFLEAERTDPQETQLFQTGRSQMREQLDRQRQQDIGQAAARGLRGTEFEVAQAGQRAQAAGQTLRGLTADAAQQQEGRRRQLLQQLLQTTGAAANIEMQRGRLDQQRRQASAQRIQQAMARLPTFMGGEGDDSPNRR